MRKFNNTGPANAGAKGRGSSHRLAAIITSILMLSLTVLIPLAPGEASVPKDQGNERGVRLSANAARQIKALREAKAARTPEQRKIESRLLHASRARRGLPTAAGVGSLRSHSAIMRNGKALVDIQANIGAGQQIGRKLRNELEGRGAEIINTVGRHIRARIDLSAVEEIAALPEIRSVRNAAQYITHSTGRVSPQSDGGSGSSQYESDEVLRARLRSMISRAESAARENVSPTAINVSEGALAHRVLEARDFYGHTGTGVKIGVISNGVDSLASLQASGDLPPNITVLPDQDGEGTEGTAMMEIIYDIAPNAQLFFATAAGGMEQFAKNIRDLRFEYDCDIIVDDVIYLGETAFQDGQASSIDSVVNGGLPKQAVKEVTADGALYFSSVGNLGNKTRDTSSTWEGNFKPLAGDPDIHDFAVDTDLNEVLGGDSIAIFQWSDPIGVSSNDYDLYIVDPTGTKVVDFSEDVQDGDDDPIEAAGALPGEFIAIVKFAGEDRFLSIHLFGGRLRQSTEGAAYGHCTAVDAFAVGAVEAGSALGAGGVFGGGESVELFSSDGGRRIFYNGDGSQITPGNLLATGGTLREKPDFSAADGVSTATPGFSVFFGTSAASPHAAAIAALLLSANKNLTASQVRTALASTAIDIGEPGVDRDSGAGIIMAMPALQSINAPILPTITNVTSSKKKLFVEGILFDNGAKIVVNGKAQKTKNDSANPSGMLTAKKGLKKVDSNETVEITVETSTGLTSRNKVLFTKP
ncbi:MAG TPA: S8 family serine peptidase [Blastocatellia bacterium]|jgi:subtilisin family serine protease